MDLSINRETARDILKRDDIMTQLEDLNTIISFFKRREENIIQILDLKSKYKNERDQDSLNRLYGFCKKIKEIEEKTIQKEDPILSKYSKYQVSDEKRKKLAERFVNKVGQIAAKVREKLIELSIYDQFKANWEEICVIQQTLKVLIKRSEINFDTLLTYSAISSRLRISEQLYGNNNQNTKLYIQAKETLQELFIPNLFDEDRNCDGEINIEQLKNANLPAYLFRPYPVRCPPVKSTSLMNSSVPDNNIPPAKSPTQADRSNSLGPQASDKKIPKLRNLRDLKAKKELIPKREAENKNRSISQEFPELIVPVYKIGTNLEALILKKKSMTRKARHSLGGNEDICKTYEYATLETETGMRNNATNIREQTLGCEKMLMVEAETIKMNPLSCAVSTRQGSSENEKDFDYLKPTDLRNEGFYEKNSKGNKIYKILSQKIKELSSGHKTRSYNSRDPSSGPKNTSLSHISEKDGTSTIEQENAKMPDLNKNVKSINKGDLLDSLEPKDVKNLKPVFHESWKNYEIMNIEYRPLFAGAKANMKKFLVDRVFCELLMLNSEIKRNLGKYYSTIVALKKERKPALIESQKLSRENSKTNISPVQKPMGKSRRSASIDNSTSFKKMPKDTQKKLEKDSKETSGDDLGVLRGSASQILNSIIQTNVLNKRQVVKPQQKTLVLPKLGLLDLQKVGTLTSEAVSLLMKNPKLPLLGNHKYFQASGLKKQEPKRMNDIEPVQDKDLLLIASGLPLLPTNVTTNRNSSMENTFEDPNCSVNDEQIVNRAQLYTLSNESFINRPQFGHILPKKEGF